MQPTCDLYDTFLDAADVLPVTLRHFGGHGAFHGRVETVKCFEDNARIKELAGTPGAGRVMVVDAGGSTRHAVLGDMIAGEAAENGWAAIIIYGAVRDVQALAELPLGVMALAATPRKSVRRGEGQTGLTIRLEGVIVAPGDLVVADADGALLFPAGGPMPDGV